MSEETPLIKRFFEFLEKFLAKELPQAYDNPKMTRLGLGEYEGKKVLAIELDDFAWKGIMQKMFTEFISPLTKEEREAFFIALEERKKRLESEEAKKI